MSHKCCVCEYRTATQTVYGVQVCDSDGCRAMIVRRKRWDRITEKHKPPQSWFDEDMNDLFHDP